MICTVEDCSNHVRSKGLCDMHYQRLRKHGSLARQPRPDQRRLGNCMVDGCVSPARAKDLCVTHYQRVRKHGDPDRNDREGRRLGDCKIAGCATPAIAKDLCAKHYLRVWKGWDAEAVSRPEPSLEERFARFTAPGEDECVVWTGALNHAGYGRFTVAGRVRKAHQVAWEMVNGPFPEGLQADHLCSNPPCVNPDHIEPVTAAENSRRRDARRAA